MKLKGKILTTAAALTLLSSAAFAQDYNGSTMLDTDVRTPGTSVDSSLDTDINSDLDNGLDTGLDSEIGIDTDADMDADMDTSGLDSDIGLDTDYDNDLGYDDNDRSARVRANMNNDLDTNAELGYDNNDNDIYLENQQTSSVVTEVQESLRASGYNVDVDGIWGPQTAGAIRTYQMDNDLDVNGRLDARTLTTMRAGPDYDG